MVLKPGALLADPLGMSQRMSTSRPPGDRGDIVLGWLTKLTVVLAVLGLLAFDGISLVRARFVTEDRAQVAARAAAATYRSGKDLQKAYDAALAEVLADGASIDPESFAIAPDGAVTLTLRTTAPTMVIEKVSPIREWADVATTVTGRPPA